MSGVRRWCVVSVFDSDGAPVTSWTVRGRGTPTLAVVDQIIGLALHARRNHGDAVVDSACPELRELLELAGLQDLLGVQMGR